MKAGRWVFATGLMAQDFVNGIAPDVLAERAPHAGLPKREKEALRIFENLDAVLRAAGTDRSNLVRTDQYYTTVKAVPPYQQVRREFLDGRIPPSTSIAQQGLLLPGADMNIQAMAAIPDDRLRGRASQTCAIGRASDLRLLAGAHGRRFHFPSGHHLARDRRRAAAQRRRRGGADGARARNGAASRSSSKPNSSSPSGWRPRWRWPARRLEDVVHAQVYLTDREDYSAFNAAWTQAFRRGRPDACRSSRASTHGLAPYDGKIEINVIAAKPGSAAAQAAYRCRRCDRFPQSAAGGEGGRSAVHPGVDGCRPRRAFARGRRGSAAAVFLVIAGDAG